MNRHFILFAIVFLSVCSGFAKTFDIDISTGRPAAANEAYYHGETIEFRAVRGRVAVTNVEYGCIYYQTNGMGQAWWRTDGLVFHPTNDVGAASYRFFLDGRDDLGRDWHANGLLRLLPSPGFAPNTIELPVARLDFAAVDVLNPPWTDPDYSTNNTALVDTIETVAPQPGDYATVSNLAVHAVQTETDPTVPSWAMASSKPGYSYSEISGTPDLGQYATTGDVAQVSSSLADHASATNNPHHVTAAQVGALPTSGGDMSGSIKWPTLDGDGDVLVEGTMPGGERMFAITAESGNVWLYHWNHKTRLPEKDGVLAHRADIPTEWPYTAITNAPWVASLAPATNYTDAVAAGLSIAIATNAAEIAAVDARAETGRVWVDWHDSVADNDQAAGYSTIYFKPSVFGMSDGAAIKSFTIKTSGNTGGLPSGAVYAKFINPDSTAAAMGVSRPVSLTSGNTVYKFEFDMAVAFATATKQYRLVFYSGAPDGSPQVNVALRLHLMASATDLYFGAGKTTWRPTMTVQWGGLIREEDPTVPGWAKASNKPSYSYSEISNTPDLSGYATTAALDDLKPSGPIATNSVVRATSGDACRVSLASGATLSAALDVEGVPVMGIVEPAGAYSVSPSIHLLGYGTWPTNSFQAVFWRVGQTTYVNVLSDL